MTVYVIVALLNYSFVQSMAGAVASNYLSNASGGTVRIASIGCNPFNHLVLHNVSLITPTGDTVCSAGKVACHFSQFPIDGQGLTVDRVMLHDTYYHLQTDSNGINLRYLIDVFASDKEEEEEEEESGKGFKVIVNDLRFDNVRYSHNLRPDKYVSNEEADSILAANPGATLKDFKKRRRRTVEGMVDIPRMDYTKINGRIRNIRVDGDHITCRIDELSTREASGGLDVHRVHGNVFVSHSGIAMTNMVIETADSHLEGDVLLDFKSWATMKHYVDSVYMTCRFLPGSYGNPRDAAYWTAALIGMDSRVAIDGYFTGPVQDLHADDVHLAFGKESTMDFDASIYGLPNIDTTIIWADIRSLHTTYSDLKGVKHPERITMKAESLMQMLDTIDLRANFEGTIYDFVADADVSTSLGDVQTNVALQMDPKHKHYRYKGDVYSNGLHVGLVAPNEWVTRGGVELSFEGNGFNPKTMKANAQGRLFDIDLKGQKLAGDANILVDAGDGKVGANVCLEDPMGNVTAHAEVEWRENGPVYTVDAEVGHLDLYKLDFWHRDGDSAARLDAHIDARYVNVAESRTYAHATLDNVHLKTSSIDYSLKNARVTMQERNKYKTLTLTTDIVNGQMRGYYEYGDLGPMLAKFRHDYGLRPGAALADREANDRSAAFEPIIGTAFDLNLEWDDKTDVLAALEPKLKVARGTSVQVNYNYAESFKVLIRSDSVRYGNVGLNRLFVSGKSLGERYKMMVESSEMLFGDQVWAEYVKLGGELSSREASCHLTWDYDDLSEAGDMHVRLLSDTSSIRVIIDPSHLTIGREVWTLSDNGRSYLADGHVVIDGVRLMNDDQSLTVRAQLLGQQDDEILVDFNNFDLAIVNPFVESRGISAGGRVEGQVNVGGLSDVPFMSGNLDIAGLQFDNEPLGDAHLVSTWNAEMNQLNLYMSTHLRQTDPSGAARFSQPIWLSGYLTLGQESPGLDFEAEFENFDLHALQPFVQSFSSRMEGYLNGDLTVGGTLKAPDFDGILEVKNAALQVDFLNVVYSFSDTVFMESGALRLDNFEVHDPRGNTAVVDGRLYHNHLQEMRLDLDVRSNRLLCMNTTPQGAAYYGTVLASVIGQVEGPLDDLAITLNARTLPGSSLYIPIDNARSVQSADYIHFISDDDYLADDTAQVMRTDVTQRSESKRNHYDLTINVQTTPDVSVNLPLTFPSLSANIKARGNGDLQIKVTDKVPFMLFGNYEMDNGTMEMSILGVLSKEFNIDPGSSIYFPGAIADARYNIKAVYPQRVNMSSLTGSLSSESQKQINVESVIELTGQLEDPSINFDIRLPNADQSVQEEVFAYIDRSNERDMMNQTMSLLLLNRFYNSSTSSAANDAANTLADNGYNIVANSLGSLVSNMVDVVDINFDYKSGNSMTTDQYAVDISKEWNKFYFESTFGYGGMAREMQNVNNNALTGDMLVGYKINPQWHLFVFNRSNTNDYTRSYLPYKQGVGIKYTRDFDRFGDLFRRRNKSGKTAVDTTQTKEK